MVNHAKRLINRANARQTVGAAAVLISLAYLVSRLIGLLRDRLLVTHYGVGADLSAYYAAFRLPELLFTLLISGAFAVAFIPVLTAKLDAGKREEAWQVTSSLLNILVLGTIAGAAIIIIFAEPLVRLLTAGFDERTFRLTVDLTRIMAVTPVLFAISSILGSVQQAFSRFFIFALAGIFYNVGIIAGIMFAPAEWGIYGAAWGVVLGVALQAMLQVLGLIGLGFRYRPILSIKLDGVMQTLKLMAPRSIDQGIDQIHYSLETLIGSTISAAAVGQFALANNLKNVPLVLIGSSITTAVFPRLTRAAAKARENLIEAYVTTARLILFLAIPSALFAFVARGYIVRLLYGRGDAETAAALGAFAGSIIFTSLFMLIARVYYSMQDTKTPLYVSLASIPIMLAASIWLSNMYGVMGLALAASCVAVLEAVVLGGILRARFGHFGEGAIWRGAWRMSISGLFMAAVVYWMIHEWLPLYAVDKGFWTLMPKFAVITVVAAIAYVVPCYLLNLNEARHLLRRARDLMTRSLNLT